MGRPKGSSNRSKQIAVARNIPFEWSADDEQNMMKKYHKCWRYLHRAVTMDFLGPQVRTQSKRTEERGPLHIYGLKEKDAIPQGLSVACKEALCEINKYIKNDAVQDELKKTKFNLHSPISLSLIHI
eukprot:TRINITY_DN29108_c0_g1_i1.p2 TRINITY_DN29108_c0_g1~~TRINITY_DN29108_c0_g1_i1.p2  ORF type:complete len:127 (-),score=10.73 TRINITY_DN29108_c0_g1_i1:125-505(-)